MNNDTLKKGNAIQEKLADKKKIKQFLLSDVSKQSIFSKPFISCDGSTFKVYLNSTTCKDIVDILNKELDDDIAKLEKEFDEL